MFCFFLRLGLIPPPLFQESQFSSGVLLCVILLMDRQTDGIENRASSAEVKRFSIYLDEKLLGLPQATTKS